MTDIQSNKKQTWFNQSSTKLFLTEVQGTGVLYTQFYARFYPILNSTPTINANIAMKDIHVHTVHVQSFSFTCYSVQ